MSGNPLDILFCWQALVFATIIYIVTHLIKKILPFIYVPKSNKGKMFLKRVVLPTIPPILGFIMGVYVPIHPEVLIAYALTQSYASWITIYGSWGAAVGQFADYIYTKVTKLIFDFKVKE